MADTLITLLPVLVVAVGFGWWSRRAQHAALPHREALDGLPGNERAAVETAVRTGRPVGDPALTGRAAAWAEHQTLVHAQGLHRMERAAWPLVGLGLLLAVIGAILLVQEFSASYLAMAVVGLLYGPAALVGIRQHRRRLARAEEALEANSGFPVGD